MTTYEYIMNQREKVKTELKKDEKKSSKSKSRKIAPSSNLNKKMTKEGMFNQEIQGNSPISSLKNYDPDHFEPDEIHRTSERSSPEFPRQLKSIVATEIEKTKEEIEHTKINFEEEEKQDEINYEKSWKYTKPFSNAKNETLFTFHPEKSPTKDVANFFYTTQITPKKKKIQIPPLHSPAHSFLRNLEQTRVETPKTDSKNTSVQWSDNGTKRNKDLNLNNDNRDDLRGDMNRLTPINLLVTEKINLNSRADIESQSGLTEKSKPFLGENIKK